MTTFTCKARRVGDGIGVFWVYDWTYKRYNGTLTLGGTARNERAAFRQARRTAKKFQKLDRYIDRKNL